MSDDELPFEKSWWIDRKGVIGGRYPGTTDPAESARDLARLLDVGVRVVINLQVQHERNNRGETFANYEDALKRLAAERNVAVEVKRFPIPDMNVPTPSRMREILAAIDDALRAGHRVYVHCWGGHGRTGTVAGCWLKRCGAACDDAFAAIKAARRHDTHLAGQAAPQTAEQRDFVRNF
jgi:protein-tyrosine phosphatase